MRKLKSPKMLLKLDFGCGTNKKQGFYGVDSIAFDGVDEVVDLRKKWPWKDSSVQEAHASHFVEHLTATERVHFINELYRVLIPDGKCTIITPHWASARAYGDMTHQWPPVSEFWFYYLSREWRLGDPKKQLGANAPHDDIRFNKGGYDCNFECTWGYALHPQIAARNQEYQQMAMQFYKEAAQDMIATLVKK